MKHFFNWLAVTVNPRYWLRNYRTSRVWDREVRRLIATSAPVTRKSPHTAQFGPHDVWIANHPYASFTLYGVAPEVMPTRRTVRLAMAYVEEALVAAAYKIGNRDSGE
jgi:hypothetical protein